MKRQEEQAAIWMDPKDLKPWGKNPRKNDHAVEAVAKSIRELGFGAPIVARSEDHRVIAGHTRLKAALKLGLEKVPVRLLEISESAADRLALADNKLGELAEWDTEALEALVRDNDVDLSELGWTDKETKRLLGLEDGSTGLISDQFKPIYQVIIDCNDEQSQDSIISELIERGIKCRALIM